MKRANAKRTMVEPFVYIAAGGYGQHKVEDAPGYKKGARHTLRTGILITQATHKGGPLEEVGFFAGPAFGWVAYNPTNNHLYAASKDGYLHALRINSEDGSLREVSRAETLGCSAHVEIAPDGKHALFANYGDGVLGVLPLGADGTIGPCTDSKMHWHEAEDEALADRQEASHPHQIRIAPREGGGGAAACSYALACDLGADIVWVYEFLPTKGALIGASNSSRHLHLPPGSGPRHLDFHPSGRNAYVLCELSGEVVTCTWDAKAGALTKVQSVSALPSGVKCDRAHHAGNSHIACAPDGKHVFALTRTDNCVAVLRVHERRGTLTRIHAVSTGGWCPRHFDVSPSDARRLRVFNQDSHTLAEFVLSDVEKGAKHDDKPEVLTTFKGVCGQCVCEVPRRV